MLAIARSLGHEGAHVPVATFGVFSALLMEDPAAGADEVVATQIGVLVDYDLKNGTDLVATVDVLLDEHLSLKAAARRLGAHVNTVGQRAQRLDVLLGHDWRTAPRAFMIHAAAKLSRLRAAAQASS